jgi:uncharacterized protein (DUF433 family)
VVSETGHPHIVSDSDILSGEPIIRGTRTPVRAIVELWRSGVPAEEIPAHLPHLSVGQVFAALGYFSDHPDIILQHIEQNRVDQDITHDGHRRAS